MSAAEFEDEDLLPDDLLPKAKVPMVRSAKQIAAAEKRARVAEQARELALAQSEAQLQAQRLAQIVNLHIGGYSLAVIGAAIGATEQEVDRLLANETARYVKNQPALRTYVRNFISAHYLELLEAVKPQAVDTTRADQLEFFDRAQRVLAQMGRLHGAEAPTQSEVKVESTPEAVDKIVAKIAEAQGRGYSTDIFDIDEEDIHEAVVSATDAVVVSGNAVEESDGHDEL